MSKIKIKIDPGHGGSSNNNVGYSKKYYEHVGMLYLSIMLKEELLSTNAFEVSLTRDRDITLSLFQRAKLAKGYDLLISEHSNAGGTTATGSEVLFSLKRLQDKAFAESMSSEIAKTLGIVSRGAKTKQGSVPGLDYYGILRYGSQFGISHTLIVESAFHSNPKEEAMLLNPQTLRRIAQAQAKVICDFYNVEYPKKEKAKSNVVQPVVNDTITQGGFDIMNYDLQPIAKGMLFNTSTLTCCSEPSNNKQTSSVLKKGIHEPINIYAKCKNENREWYLVNKVNPQWIAAAYVQLI